MHSKFYLFNMKRQASQARHLKRLKLFSHHPVFIPLAVFVLLVVFTLGGLFVFNRNKVVASDAFIVVVSHDHTQQTVPTREPNVGALLKKMDIKVRPGDVVEPAENTPINQDDFHVNVYRGVPVEIVDGAKKTFTYSAATTPRSIVAQAGVQVYAEDKLQTLPTTNFLEEDAIGERVVITRSVPVSLNLYGHEVTARTLAKTVGDLLQEKGIKLKQGDTVTPNPSSPITPDLQIEIAHKGTKYITKTETIAMPVKRINDPNQAYGVVTIRQQGSPGKKATTYEILLKNGKKVGEEKLETVVTQEPVQQIEVIGTSLSGIKADMARAGISPADYGHVDFIFTRESNWNPADVNASGCAGLGQACPGSTLAVACPNWQSDPICQMRYFSNYALRHHGGWAESEIFWRNHGWW